MAVAYDTDTQDLNKASTGTSTFSHTCTGSNLALVVFVVLEGSAQTVSSITYNGVGLSSIGILAGSAGVSARIEAWGLAAPASGAHNVVTTLSANNTAWDVSAISFTGANQTGGATTFNGFATGNNSASTSTASCSVTSGSTSDMVVDCSSSVTNNGTTSGASQTQRWQDNSGTTNTQGSTKTGASGSVTMTENWDATTGANEYHVVGLNITAVSTAKLPPKSSIVGQAVKRAAYYRAWPIDAHQKLGSREIRRYDNFDLNNLIGKR